MKAKILGYAACGCWLAVAWWAGAVTYYDTEIGVGLALIVFAALGLATCWVTYSAMKAAEAERVRAARAERRKRIDEARNRRA